MGMGREIHSTPQMAQARGKNQLKNYNIFFYLVIRFDHILKTTFAQRSFFIAIKRIEILTYFKVIYKETVELKNLF